MKLLQVYRAAALGFLAFKGLTLLVNAATFPKLRPNAPSPAAPARPAPRVSVLIPARDEALTLPTTLPGILAQGADEVLVLDDHSSDGTAQIAAHLGAAVIAGRPLPDGWFGKSWACQQLAEAATGDILIFTDADVSWHPGALGAVLRELERCGADLLSVLPRPERLTLGARLLTPLVDAVVLCWLPHPLLRARNPYLVSANGQLMAFWRAAYTAAGGHALVKAEMLEDTEFARRLKARGFRVSLALGAEAVGVQMYRSYPASVEGFAKNALAIHSHSRLLLVASLGWHLAVYTVPWLLPVRRFPSSRWIWGLRLAGILERSLVNLLTGRHRPADLAEGLLGPLTPLLALPAYRRALGRRVIWKGRVYRQD
ncbi:glycosyltransferase [Deinococcus altitudinis]|uniref:glycosyltransferase n=1 Tax=Deinococcus altitudinis TaxID=468914 RepID=UPI0038922559